MSRTGSDGNFRKHPLIKIRKLKSHAIKIKLAQPNDVILNIKNFKKILSSTLHPKIDASYADRKNKGNRQTEQILTRALETFEE